MKTKLEVLYANVFLQGEVNGKRWGTPVVRYADACAAISRLESDLELKEALLKNSQKRCAELIKELERMALLSKTDSLAVLEEKIHARDMTGKWDGKPGGRWDGKCKVL